MFEPPQRLNNQESSEESNNGDKDDQQDRRINTWLVLKNDRVDFHYKFSTMKYCIVLLSYVRKKPYKDYLSLNSRLFDPPPKEQNLLHA